MITKQENEKLQQLIAARDCHSIQLGLSSSDELHNRAVSYAKAEIELLDYLGSITEPQPDSEGWIANTGTQPVSDDTLVDIKLRKGDRGVSRRAASLDWKLRESKADIVKWQPRTTAVADSDGWIEWGGGERCPVPNGTRIDVRHRDGEVFHIVMPGDLCCFSWEHTAGPGDIVAYRLSDNS